MYLFSFACGVIYDIVLEPFWSCFYFPPLFLGSTFKFDERVTDDSLLGEGQGSCFQIHYMGLYLKTL